MSRARPSARKRRTDVDRTRVLGMLADGEFHSGQWIAAQLGVSRSAVWKHLEWLRARGIGVAAVPRRGYRMSHRVELLDPGRIVASIEPVRRARLERLDVCLDVDSTNLRVGAWPAPAPGRACACVAEIQTAGRGRRGRTWLAPFGSGLCLSLAWTFTELPASFPALGLAVGIGVVRALASLGVVELGLKWPNDVVWRGRKVGGILIEVRGDVDRGTHVVIGIGLNVQLAPAVRLELAEHHGVQASDLREVAAGPVPSRNVIAGAILGEVPAVLLEFEAGGFAPFTREWDDCDAVRGSAVRLSAGTQVVRGIASGVAADGALLLDTGGRLERFVSGELSLRVDRIPDGHDSRRP